MWMVFLLNVMGTLGWIPNGRLVPITGSEKLANEACKLQSNERVVPKSTSWIMSWCWQEAIRHRRAIMNPTSMTQNRANDFNGGENDLRIQGLGWQSWKDGAWMYCSGWDTGEFSEWLLLNIPTKLTWWIGSVNPKCGWCDGPMVMWPVNGTTQLDSDAEWKCHVQEQLATNKVFSSFLPNFPQSFLTTTSLFLSSLRRITYDCSIIYPLRKPITIF